MNNLIDENYLPETSLPDEKYLQAYFGTQAQYYTEKYRSYLLANKFTFNIAPFFIGFLWFFYRKLWIEGTVILIFTIVLGVVEGFVYDLFAVSESIQTTIFYVSSFAFGMLWGFTGNYFYLRRSEKSINDVLSTTSDEEERVGMLSKKGGVSLIPFIIILLFIILILLL